MKLVFFKDGFTPEEVGAILADKFRVAEYGETYLYIPTPGYIEPVVYKCNRNVIFDNTLSDETKLHLVKTFFDNYDRISREDYPLSDRSTFLVALDANTYWCDSENLEIEAFKIDDTKESAEWFINKYTDCKDRYEFVLIRSTDDCICEDLEVLKDNFVYVDYSSDALCIDNYERDENYVAFGAVGHNDMIHLAAREYPDYGVFDKIVFNSDVPRIINSPNYSKSIMIINKDMFMNDKLAFTANPFSDINLKNIPVIIAHDVSNLSTRFSDRCYTNGFSFTRDGDIFCSLDATAINTMRFIAIANRSQLFINKVPVTKGYKLCVNTVEDFYNLIDHIISTNGMSDKIKVQIMNPYKCDEGYKTIAEISHKPQKNWTADNVTLFIDKLVSLYLSYGVIKSLIEKNNYEIDQVK